MLVLVNPDTESTVQLAPQGRMQMRARMLDTDLTVGRPCSLARCAVLRSPVGQVVMGEREEERSEDE